MKSKVKAESEAKRKLNISEGIRKIDSILPSNYSLSHRHGDVLDAAFRFMLDLKTKNYELCFGDIETERSLEIGRLEKQLDDLEDKTSKYEGLLTTLGVPLSMDLESLQKSAGPWQRVQAKQSPFVSPTVQASNLKLTNVTASPSASTIVLNFAMQGLENPRKRRKQLPSARSALAPVQIIPRERSFRDIGTSPKSLEVQENESQTEVELRAIGSQTVCASTCDTSTNTEQVQAATFSSSQVGSELGSGGGVGVTFRSERSFGCLESPRAGSQAVRPASGYSEEQKICQSEGFGSKRHRPSENSMDLSREVLVQNAASQCVPAGDDFSSSVLGGDVPSGDGHRSVEVMTADLLNELGLLPQDDFQSGFSNGAPLTDSNLNANSHSSQAKDKTLLISNILLDSFGDNNPLATGEVSNQRGYADINTQFSPSDYHTSPTTSAVNARKAENLRKSSDQTDLRTAGRGNISNFSVDSLHGISNRQPSTSVTQTGAQGLQAASTLSRYASHYHSGNTGTQPYLESYASAGASSSSSVQWRSEKESRRGEKESTRVPDTTATSHHNYISNFWTNPPNCCTVWGSTPTALHQKDPSPVSNVSKSKSGKKGTRKDPSTKTHKSVEFSSHWSGAGGGNGACFGYAPQNNDSSAALPSVGTFTPSMSASQAGMGYSWKYPGSMDAYWMYGNGNPSCFWNTSSEPVSGANFMPDLTATSGSNTQGFQIGTGQKANEKAPPSKSFHIAQMLDPNSRQQFSSTSVPPQPQTTVQPGYFQFSNSAANNTSGPCWGTPFLGEGGGGF